MKRSETDCAETGLSFAELQTMRSVEDDLWWYRALRSHVIRSIGPRHSELKLLDAGCGSGGMLARIRESFPRSSLVGLDYMQGALELTEQRRTGAQLIQGSADRLPFGEAEFDVVLSLDVIVVRGVDARAAIGEMHRVLRPRGLLIMNVPALGFLRGSHDLAVNNVRRYNRPQLRRLLHEAGFSVRNLTYWNMSLLPAVALVRLKSRWKTETSEVHSDLTPIPRPLNAALTVLARAELAVSRHLPLPFGTSLFAVSVK